MDPIGFMLFICQVSYGYIRLEEMVFRKVIKLKNTLIDTIYSEKKELNYFNIGSSFGGNQDWLKDPWMHLGGCGALAACDSILQMEYSGIKKNLSNYDVNKISVEEYIDFAMEMKPYLRPRFMGINKLSIFVDGFKEYMKDKKLKDINLEAYEGTNKYLEAVEVLKNQLDKNFPVPFLMLRNKNNNVNDLVWHWFMLVGYAEYDGQFMVKMATYGSYRYINFKELWNTGYKKKGGMILWK